LDEIIAHEEGKRFQALAIVLAKQKYPDLIASEYHKDLGLDAYAAPSVAPDRVGRGVASSITASLGKITGDARRANENFPEGLSPSRRLNVRNFFARKSALCGPSWRDLTSWSNDMQAHSVIAAD
jgi:hypothetical protein